MVRFTSEEMKGIMKQPQDSCPFFNNVIQIISKRIEDFDYKNITKVNEDIYDNIYKAFDIIDDIISIFLNSFKKKSVILKTMLEYLLLNLET